MLYISRPIFLQKPLWKMTKRKWITDEEEMKTNEIKKTNDTDFRNDVWFLIRLVITMFGYWCVSAMSFDLLKQRGHFKGSTFQFQCVAQLLYSKNLLAVITTVRPGLLVHWVHLWSNFIMDDSMTFTSTTFYPAPILNLTCNSHKITWVKKGITAQNSGNQCPIYESKHAWLL